MLNDAGTKYKTLEDPRQFGWEIQASANLTTRPQRPDARIDGRFDGHVPPALGPQDVPGPADAFGFGRQRQIPRLRGNGDDVLGIFLLLHVADGNCDDSTLRPFMPWFRTREPLEAQLHAGYGQGENNGARWFIDAEKKSAEKLDLKDISPEMSNGKHWLHIEGVSPEKISQDRVAAGAWQTV